MEADGWHEESQGQHEEAMAGRSDFVIEEPDGGARKGDNSSLDSSARTARRQWQKRQAMEVLGKGLEDTVPRRLYDTQAVASKKGGPPGAGRIGLDSPDAAGDMQRR